MQYHGQDLTKIQEIQAGLIGLTKLEIFYSNFTVAVRCSRGRSLVKRHAFQNNNKVIRRNSRIQRKTTQHDKDYFCYFAISMMMGRSLFSILQKLHWTVTMKLLLSLSTQTKAKTWHFESFKSTIFDTLMR